MYLSYLACAAIGMALYGIIMLIFILERYRTNSGSSSATLQVLFAASRLGPEKAFLWVGVAMVAVGLGTALFASLGLLISMMRTAG